MTISDEKLKKHFIVMMITIFDHNWCESFLYKVMYDARDVSYFIPIYM